MFTILLQLSAEGFGGSDAPKQVQSLHFIYSFTLNAQEHDYIMCNAQFQGHEKRDIASIDCMCPN